MGCNSKLKGFDKYGHQVMLNFNQQGETVNTPIGGFISIVMNILIYGYFILKFQEMIDKGGNEISR